MLTYDLPKERIAQRPCEPRDAARLLVLTRRTGGIAHRVFRDLPDFLHAGDCLVLNDTRVLPARLHGQKAETGGKVELLLLERELPPSDGVPGKDDKCVEFRCLGQPARSLRPGTRLLFDHGGVHATVIGWEEGERRVRFEGRGVEQTLRRLAEVPLPPYIGRPVQPEDAGWYQTVYAREPGAVAAPTAGLHFTPELLEGIRRMGVAVRFITLHVGWGTFKPVGERELASGRLHAERYAVPAETAQAIADTKAKGGRIVAVGTTVIRALETSALRQAQGEGSAMTDLFIRPGFKFQVVDALVTNFHLPGTSLLLLVEAFAGEGPLRAAYEEAIRGGYRFYSYGDAMLII